MLFTNQETKKKKHAYTLPVWNLIRDFAPPKQVIGMRPAASEHRITIVLSSLVVSRNHREKIRAPIYGLLFSTISAICHFGSKQIFGVDVAARLTC